MAKTTMPKKKSKSRQKIGGPFLAAAFFCENVLEDKDGVLSAMRIVDTINVAIHPSAPADFPSAETPLQLQQNMLFIIKTGDAPGKYEFSITAESPAGKKQEVDKREIELHGPVAGGLNIRHAITFLLRSAGVYWFSVRINRKLMTRVPLSINVIRIPKPETIIKSSARPN